MKNKTSKIKSRSQKVTRRDTAYEHFSASLEGWNIGFT